MFIKCQKDKKIESQNDGKMEGQGKSSIAPTCQSRAIIRYLYKYIFLISPQKHMLCLLNRFPIALFHTTDFRLHWGKTLHIPTIHPPTPLPSLISIPSQKTCLVGTRYLMIILGYIFLFLPTNIPYGVGTH